MNGHSQHGIQEEAFPMEVLSVLTDAKVTLREDDILAVVAIRRELALFSALQQLILEGECGAALVDGVPKHAPLAVDNYGFYWLTEEDHFERGELPATPHSFTALPQGQHRLGGGAAEISSAQSRPTSAHRQ